MSILTQSGGDFVITKSVISGGGGSSTGGVFAVDSTIGQTAPGDVLSGGAFSVTSGFWNYTVNNAAGQGLEGDVAARPSGDGSVLSNDVVQVQRFQIGLDQSNQLNEFQRADSAPFASRGDGAINSTDVVQTQRYQIGLDPQQTAAGPVDGGGFAAARSEKGDRVLGGREVRIENGAAGYSGQQVAVNVRVDAIGDESAYGFTVTYNQAVLTAPTTAIGTAGGSRFCNAATPGQINCSINNFPNDLPGSSTDQIGEILPGTDQLLLRITFTIAISAPSGATAIGLTNVNASNDAAVNLPITSQNGSVNVAGPTVAAVAISGRVVTVDGVGIHNAVILLQRQNGEILSARSSAFGYYMFEGIPVGQSVFVTVEHKRFNFEPRLVMVADNVTDLDFVGVSLSTAFRSH